MTDTYTEAELETLPQTETIFDQPALDFNSHTWVQQGYTIVDTCGTHPSQGIAIPSGMLLTRKDGVYSLVDELTRK